MRVRFEISAIGRVKAPLLALLLTRFRLDDPRLKPIDSALSGKLRQIAQQDGYKAKPGQMLELSVAGRLPADRVLLVGLGKDAHSEPARRLRTAAAKVGRLARDKGVRRLALVVPELEGIATAEVVRWLTEGIVLGAYRFSLKTGDRVPKSAPGSASLVLATDGQRTRPRIDQALREAAATGLDHAGGVTLARDLVNTPANQLGPIALAERAKELAQRRGLKAQVMGLAEIQRRGMQLLAAVGAGSRSEPRFVHLIYRPADARPRGRLALVGKGITFDSGGLSLKPAAAQSDMKSDMAGAALVLGVLEAAAARAVPWEIHGIIPTCENMPDGGSYRPGDVVGSLDGKTVEINNTDAEGRLILADALAYARKLELDLVVDFATLTGACMVALGPTTAGLFGNDPTWIERMLAAGRRAGEDLWHLPLNEDLFEQLKSEVADLKNTGTRWGGAITAALFLKEFAGKRPWLHLDIAGPAFLEKAHGFHPKGGTGFGVLTMLDLLTLADGA